MAWWPLMMVLACVVLKAESVSMGHEQPYYSQNYGYGEQEGGYMSDWSMEWDQGGLQQQKCIDIPQNMSLCKNIGYTQMRLPNLLDHDTIREVTQQSSSWVPLLGIRCHPDTKLFLCSLFSPVCLDRPIWPCRTLCESVKNGCEALMLKYGFPWPEMLRCDKFPLDNDLCIGLQHDNKPVETAVDDSLCEACNQPDTYEAIVDNYCSADFVYRIEIAENVVSGNDLKITTARKKKGIKKGGLTRRDIRSMLLYITNGANCDCRHLSDVLTLSSRNGGAKEKKSYLAMGARRADKLVLQYLLPNDKNNADLKRAMKAMRKGDVCKDGLNVLHQNGNKRRRKGNGEVDAPNSGVVSNQQGDLGDNNENKKRRKTCKNPKKCVSTENGQPQDRKRNKGRSNRRKSRGRQRGSRAQEFS